MLWEKEERNTDRKADRDSEKEKQKETRFKKRHNKWNYNLYDTNVVEKIEKKAEGKREATTGSNGSLFDGNGFTIICFHFLGDSIKLKLKNNAYAYKRLNPFFNDKFR